jgi:hypothetical protein
MFVAFLFLPLSAKLLGYGLVDPLFESRRGKEFYIFSDTSRPVLGLTHPPIQWATRALPPKLQWQGREFNRSLPPSVKVKNEGRYTFTLPIRIHDVQ